MARIHELRPPPHYELPTCKACGRREYCNTVRLANEPPWDLCPQSCMPAFLAEAQGWLRREQRHAELLRDAGDDGEDETERVDPEAQEEFLRFVMEHAKESVSEACAPHLAPAPSPAHQKR